MAKQTIFLGTAPNDDTGDPARTAFDKCNDNFDELYAGSAIDHGSLSGLADDDHTQYSLADGTRDFTGDVTINAADFILDQTTFANQNGIVYKGSDIWLHDFNYGDNGVVTTLGQNVFCGIGAGNFTLGATATDSGDASNNVGMGYFALNALTTGRNNTSVGAFTNYRNTTGSNNLSMGNSSLAFNLVGNSNVALGFGALYLNTGSYCIGISEGALASKAAGDNVIALGYNAGRYQADGVTPLAASVDSLYIGHGSRGYDNNDDNSIVIGVDAIGQGANTTVIGNSSTTATTIPAGNFGLGKTPESGWTSTWSAFEFGLRGSLSTITSSSGGTVMANNAYYDGADWNYQETDEAALLVVQADGSLDFFTAPSGTADTAMTLTNRFNVQNDGNVGIGTDAPSKQLSIVNESTTATFRMFAYSDTPTDRANFQLGHARGTEASATATQSGDSLGKISFQGYDTAISTGASIEAVAAAEWGTAGDTTDNPTDLIFSTVPDGSNIDTERMRITNDGNVGIGTDSPQELLHVEGANASILISDTDATPRFLRFNSNTDTMRVTWDDSDNISFGTSDAETTATQNEFMRITSGGNVGIGTDAPATKLDVEDSSNGAITILGLHNSDNTAATNATVRLDMNLSDTGDNEKVGGRISVKKTADWSSAANEDAEMRFSTRRDGTLTNAMFIDKDGSVGIGANTPARNLHVNSSTTSAYLALTNSGTGHTASDGFQINNLNGAVSIWNYENDYIQISTNNDEKIRILADGSVGFNESAPDVDPGGLCLNHGDNDGNVFTLKNSDVSHPFTGLNEADTYFSIQKASDTTGGAYFKTMGEASYSFFMDAMGANPDSTTSTAAVGLFHLRSRDTNGGTGATSIQAGDNLAVFANNSSAAIIFKGNGDIYTDTDQTSGLAGTFDKEDDILLARAAQLEVKGYKKHNLKKHANRLQELGIMDGSFLSMQKITDLQLGAIGQLFNVMKGLAKKLNITEEELLTMAREY